MEYAAFIQLQNFIIEKQKSGKPFFIGRLSGNETRFTGNILGMNGISPDLIRNMLYVAGISFDNVMDIELYANLYNQSVSRCDMLGTWTGNMRDQAIGYYNHIDALYPTIPRIAAQAMEPYYYMESMHYNFPKIFENKRVLIISSHYQTVKSQLGKRDVLFHKPIFSESTEFFVYKPPQQNGGNHDGRSWTVHMDAMKQDLANIKREQFDFDIALVSCGGFGMIISDYIFSELNSSVMYVGGALQLYFGIMGERWSANDRVLKQKNDEWTRPVNEDKPKKPEMCENNCYW